jgi:hypothetical protein
MYAVARTKKTIVRTMNSRSVMTVAPYQLPRFVPNHHTRPSVTVC